jgi:16S rRNA (uracil1498-N3)-methyltransferase
MSRPRFFVSEPCAVGSEIRLDPQDARHAKTVLRMQTGDAVTLVRDGVAWEAALTQVASNGVCATCTGIARDERGELPLDVTLLQAVAKGAKLDFVVEKAVELGVRRIVAVACERSESVAGAHKLQRWRRIARAAAEQSRRLMIPAVDSSGDWETAVQPIKNTARFIVAHESAPSGSLASAIGDVRKGDAIAIAVGPEGSFTERELAIAKAAGAAFVSLGPTIVRTETAGLALLAAIASRFW